MLNHLEAPARLVIRICLGLFTTAVLLLLQSSFWTNAVSGWMRAIIIATAILAYFRPHLAVLLLAVLVPLGQVGSRTLNANMRGAEALVLAFLMGALLRGWVLHRFRSVPSSTLQIVSFVFGLVVAASCVEQLWFAQLQRNFPAAFLQDVLRYAGRRYIVGFDNLDMIFSAMLLLEGMALMLYAAHYCRARVGFAERLVVMLVVGALASAAVNFIYAAAYLRQAGLSIQTLKEMLIQRWSFHVGDVNAAGSFFAMAMLIAFAAARVRTRHRELWAAAGFVLGFALWFTASRTAVLATGLIVIAGVAKAVLGRSTSAARTAVVGFITVAGLGAVIQLFPAGFFGATAEYAVRIRWLFLGATFRMVSAEPIFGIGVGQYSLWSMHFASPELRAIYTRDNAHNYFAQMAGELGLIGFVAFIGVLATALWMRSDRTDARFNPMVGPMVAGLAVFILTWLGGHPLLVPEVSYPFWLALAIVPGLVPAVARIHRTGLVGSLLLFAALAVSIPPRVTSKSASIDFTRVTYGMSSGTINANGRFFVASGASQLRIPLRARDATPEAPIIMDILVDDRPAATVTFGDSGWRDAQVDLPRSSHGASRRIDLRTREREQRSRVDVGKWEIISVPHA